MGAVGQNLLPIDGQDSIVLHPSTLEGPRQLRVLVVDDHRTVGELLARALQVEPDLMCVASVTTAARALDLLSRDPVDVAVVDLRLPDLDGLELCRRIQRAAPRTRVMILTAFATPALVARAAAAGAFAVLPKDGTVDAMLSAIRGSGDGQFRTDPDLLAGMSNLGPRGLGPQRVHLTAREEEVLQLLAGGLTMRGVARSLGISVHTCQGHLKALYRKLGAHTALEAVVTAGRLGLLEVHAVDRP